MLQRHQNGLTQSKVIDRKHSLFASFVFICILWWGTQSEMKNRLRYTKRKRNMKYERNDEKITVQLDCCNLCANAVNPTTDVDASCC